MSCLILRVAPVLGSLSAGVVVVLTCFKPHEGLTAATMAGAFYLLSVLVDGHGLFAILSNSRDWRSISSAASNSSSFHILVVIGSSPFFNSLAVGLSRSLWMSLAFMRTRPRSLVMGQSNNACLWRLRQIRIYILSFRFFRSVSPCMYILIVLLLCQNIGLRTYRNGLPMRFSVFDLVGFRADLRKIMVIC